MSKKDFERHWLDLARAARPDLLSGTVTPGEAPDFLISRESGTLGVEVTRYSHRSVPDQPAPEQQTGLRRKILKLAKQRFASRSATWLRVGAVFNAYTVIPDRRVDPLASAIADELFNRLHGAPEWSRTRWSADDEACVNPPPSELATVYATVVPSVGNTPWYPAQAGWVEYASAVEVARIVAAKESKVSGYRQRCDKIALLIAFEGTPHAAQAVHAPEPPIEYVLRTAFDQLLCLDVLEKRVVEVQTCAPAV